MREHCFRCGGWMVETFVEGEAVCRDDPAGTWKCVNCGEVIDSQILANRQFGTHTQRRTPISCRAFLPLGRVSGENMGRMMDVSGVSQSCRVEHSTVMGAKRGGVYGGFEKAV